MARNDTILHNLSHRCFKMRLSKGNIYGVSVLHVDFNSHRRKDPLIGPRQQISLNHTAPSELVLLSEMSRSSNCRNGFK